ncbi:MAG: diaminopimelate decarboxylase [Elusimicrobia bacterium]|nr:diaminopimelate decarboxylase [Candidatus Liberimonas magnetica]
MKESLHYRKNNLYFENASLEKLADKFGTPLYVYSKSKLIENYRSFDSAFKKVPHLVCYAMKANSNSTVLKTLAGLGSGVDVTSGGELYRSLKAGFSPERTVYAGIGKTAVEIEYALKHNILMFNVESIEELELIGRLAKRHNKKASIALRVNPHVDAHTHKYITTGKSGSKFGIPYPEALVVYKLASKIKSIDAAGLHCHIGSQITEVKPFHLTSLRMAKIVNELFKAGIKLRYIDFGGGLGIQYRHENVSSPTNLADAVLVPFKGFKGTFVFEPGRYIVGNTGILLVKVTYRKKADGKNFLIVDGGMNDLIRPTLYEAYHDIIPVKNPAGPKLTSDVVGPICETGDFLGQSRLLPWLAQGEYLAVKCAGAYSMAMSSQYNSRPRAAEIMINGSKYKMVREREKYEDLVRKERING